MRTGIPKWWQLGNRGSTFACVCLRSLLFHRPALVINQQGTGATGSVAFHSLCLVL